MPFHRTSGILLHPTSFPSQFGIGDLGLEAYRFIDFLVESAQQLWQVLPLGPTGDSNSPYASYSAMAGNPLLLSLEVLQNIGLLDNEDLANLSELSTKTVDFSRVIQTKTPLLRKACENFKTNASSHIPPFKCHTQIIKPETLSRQGFQNHLVALNYPLLILN